MANDRAPRITITDRLDLAELPLGSLVEIQTKNSTYWLTTLAATIFSAGYATGLMVTSNRENSWDDPRDVNIPQVVEIDSHLSIVNPKKKLETFTSKITSIKITR